MKSQPDTNAIASLKLQTKKWEQTLQLTLRPRPWWLPRWLWIRLLNLTLRQEILAPTIAKGYVK